MHGLPVSKLDLAHTDGDPGERQTALNSPTFSRNSSNGGNGKKRNLSAVGFIASPESPEDGVDEVDERRKLPGVKRACNECRQQKATYQLRCDVVQEPEYIPCKRCDRLGLDCKIDANFRRIGKRHKNAEMEKELSELRAQLSSQQASPTLLQHPMKTSASTSASPKVPHIPSSIDQYIGSQEAVASLMDLKSGVEGGSYLRGSNGSLLPTRRLEGVKGLRGSFFTFYHPFLPFLEPNKSPDQYYAASPLLFWVIISVAARRYDPDPSLFTSLAGPVSRLLWVTLESVPQSYFVVKALCIVCTWPTPISSTSADPTFMLSGMMMQIAKQIGLHRPSHAQDFTKFKVELREEELKDRVRTWATCNAVAQRVATGYGQPPISYYDWTLGPHSANDISFRLPEEPEARLLIERFCDKVTQALYTKYADPVGLPNDTERSSLMKLLKSNLQELEARLKTHTNPTSVSTLYLRAAELHLSLSTFFDSPTSEDYKLHLMQLWMSTTSFLESASSADISAGFQIHHATNYILQMIIAAGFSLLKLLNSFFANHVDLDYGKKLFKRAIWMIRTISISANDLPSRLAEVLAQLWVSGGSGSRIPKRSNEVMDSSLQLKVRCRMSMSLVYDSVWRWREEFQAKGKGNLESAVSNPTNLDSAAESTASSTIVEPTFPPPAMLGEGNVFDDATYEVFDPLAWTLDGHLDFPFGFPEGTGIT
ncbi:MAG: hypothetical protein Q9195_008109 [Heterodermia aff. obscurata]